jgi:catalase
VRHAEDDDCVQAGMPYRLMGEDEKRRLVDQIAGSLAKVSREDVIERSIEHFRRADPDYGRRVELGVKASRG